MKYIRTEEGKIFDVNKICVPYQVIESWIDFNSQGRFEIVKQADTIQALVITGDLLIVEDRTSRYPYATFPHIYNEQRPFAYECAIYKLVELYIKDQKGNYIKVAQKNEKSGELELL